MKEGKIELTAERDGLFKVHSDGMKCINSFGQMMIASRHGNFPMKKGGAYLAQQFSEQVKPVWALERWELYDVDIPEDLVKLREIETGWNA